MLTPRVSFDIKESDWKLFRKLRSLALDRFCQRVCSEVARIADETGQTPHERYLAIYQLMREKDRALAEMFDDPRRSTALFQLALIYSQGLLSEEEFAGFAPETRESITRT
jgi:hypothetical protein